MRRQPLVLIVGFALAAPVSLAQERTGGMEARPPPSSKAWVKLCETPAMASNDFFGKAQVIGAKTCLTHHERLDGTSGMVLVAAAVRQTGGRQHLTVMVPAGVQQAPGVRVYIYPSSLWERVQKKEQLQKRDEGRVGVLNLKYTLCHAGGCTAETDATPELIADLKSNAGLMIFVIRSGQPIAFPIPLSGFREAYEGPPVDSERYHEARNELLRKIRDRQKQGERKQSEQPGR